MITPNNMNMTNLNTHYSNDCYIDGDECYANELLFILLCSTTN
jgi:hypothetical protein